MDQDAEGRMKIALALALRDLRGSRAGLRLLFVCLFLGVATLAGIGSLSSAILSELSTRGQVILGGDFEMEASQRYATAEERAAFDRVGTVSETVRMRAMASSGDGTNAILGELKGVDAKWPLYGDFRLAPGAIAKRPNGLDVAVMPALAERLGVKVGERFRMGEADFRIIGLIAEEPDRLGEGFTLGPVVLASMDGVNATQLVQPGSLFTTRYRIRMPNGDPAAAAEALNRQFKGAGWDTKDSSNGAPGTRRFIGRLGQFLSLLGLAAMIVAGIGVGNGVGTWLEAKRTQIATLKILGAEARLIFATYLAQIGVVVALAIVAGLALGALVPWIVANLAGDQLPVAPRIGVYPLALLTAAVFGLLVALMFSIAPLARARRVTVATLFRNGMESDGHLGSKPVAIAVGLTGGLIALLATVTAREPVFAAIFLAVAGLLFLALTGLGVAIRKLAAAAPRPRHPLARLALANLHRPRAQTSQLVVALGLGLTLFATLAGIQTSLSRQIETTIPKRAPSYFALDIPKEDLARFVSTIRTSSPDAVIATVPSLRGPVVAIGDKRVVDMKDIPDGAWFLRGDRGLTFAEAVPDGSELVGGKWWPANYAGPPLVSLDEQAATAAGLKIGDKLTVSILGRELEAEISSLRRINWETMGFNFVLVFSPSALEAAPYTVMATVTADAASEATISRAVSAGFPSVSLIRVKELIGQIGTALGQLSNAVAIAAAVALLAGIAVLWGAVTASRASRTYDSVLLKVLGATRRQVLTAQAIEYAGLATLLSLLALAIGAAASWFVMTRVFELGWTPDWPIVLATVGAGGLGTMALGLLGALPSLAARPATALRSL